MQKHITPVRLLIVAGVIGAVWHFWPSDSQTASPSGPSETTVRETSKPKSNPKTAVGAVAQLEGNASFSKVPPPRPTDDELLQIHENSKQQ